MRMCAMLGAFTIHAICLYFVYFKTCKDRYQSVHRSDQSLQSALEMHKKLL